MKRLFLTTAIASGLAAAPALAQTEIDPGDVIPLDRWQAQNNFDEMGWSVDRMLDSPVFTAEGREEIGEVEDVLFDADGSIVSVVAEVGGFADLGDHHVSVPWDEVEMDEETTGIRVPLDEETVADYDPFEYAGIEGMFLDSVVQPGLDDAAVARAWRARELIGDYARLIGEETPVYYGYVSDILIEDGAISATVVSAAGNWGGGYFAYPNYTRVNPAWSPGDAYYDLPYYMGDVETMEPMDRGGS